MSCTCILQEYLARLEAIRKQNYAERKRIKERVYAPSQPKATPPSESEEHKHQGDQKRPHPSKPVAGRYPLQQPVERVQHTPVPQFDVESRRKKIAALKVRKTCHVWISQYYPEEGRLEHLCCHF